VGPDLENLRAAAERVEHFPDGLAVRTLTARSTAIFGRGLADEALRHTQEAFERTRTGSNIPLVAAVVAWSRHGIRCMDRTGPDGGVSALRKAIALAETGPIHESGVQVQLELARHLYRRAEWQEAENILTSARARAAKEAPRLEATIVHEMGRMHLRAGRPEQAERAAEDALTIWTDRADHVGIATAHWALGFLRLKGGEYEAAEAHFQATIEAFEQVRDGQAPTLHSLLGLVALERGALDEAEETLASSIEWCRQTGALQYLAEDHVVLALVLLRQDRPADALVQLQASDEVYLQVQDRTHHLEGRLMAAMAQALTGDWRGAERQLRRCEADEALSLLSEHDVLVGVTRAIIDIVAAKEGAQDRAAALASSLDAEGRRATFVARAAVAVLAMQVQM
jgi:tetratricopeptide (TPR) repeat protein